MKDERITALETENAMLYLKLAQLRGSLQGSREEVSGLQQQYESETKFRQTVIESALKFKQELDVSFPQSSDFMTFDKTSLSLEIYVHHNLFITLLFGSIA